MHYRKKTPPFEGRSPCNSDVRVAQGCVNSTRCVTVLKCRRGRVWQPPRDANLRQRRAGKQWLLRSVGSHRAACVCGCVACSGGRSVRVSRWHGGAPPAVPCASGKGKSKECARGREGMESAVHCSLTTHSDGCPLAASSRRGVARVVGALSRRPLDALGPRTTRRGRVEPGRPARARRHTRRASKS